MDFFFSFFPCAILSHSRHSRCAECEPEQGAEKRVGWEDWGGVKWLPLFFSTQAEEAANASFALMSDVFMRRLHCHLPRGSCEVALLRCNLLNDEVAREKERALPGPHPALLQPHLHATMCSSHLSSIATASHQPTPAGVASSAPCLRNYTMAL